MIKLSKNTDEQAQQYGLKSQSGSPTQRNGMTCIHNDYRQRLWPLFPSLGYAGSHLQRLLLLHNSISLFDHITAGPSAGFTKHHHKILPWQKASICCVPMSKQICLDKKTLTENNLPWTPHLPYTSGSQLDNLLIQRNTVQCQQSDTRACYRPLEILLVSKAATIGEPSSSSFLPKASPCFRIFSRVDLRSTCSFLIHNTGHFETTQSI